MMALCSRLRSVPALLALALVAACTQAPITGRSQFIAVDPSTESQLGLQAFQQFMATHTASANAQGQAEVERVGRRIAKASGLNADWRFVLVDDKQVNAFALPGGKVVVFSGLLPVAKTEAGLATVLAHEIGHVIARHGAERVSQAQLLQLGSQAAGSLLGSYDPATQQTIAGLLGAGVTYGVELPFSRQQEAEADRIGLILMAKAGYDPRAAIDFWQRMSAASRGNQPLEFMSDHPSDANRIAALEQQLPEALSVYQQSRTSS